MDRETLQFIYELVEETETFKVVDTYLKYGKKAADKLYSQLLRKQQESTNLITSKDLYGG